MISAEAQEIVKGEHYQAMIREWKTIVFIFLAIEASLVVACVLYVGYFGAVFWPSVFGMRLPSLAEMAPAFYLATLTINGIIVGFFAVSIFFYFGWSSETISSLESRKKEDLTPGVKRSLSNGADAIRTVRKHVTRYAQIYIKISITLMIFQTILFPCIFASDLILIVDMFVNLDALLCITVGLYPVLTKVLNTF
jgi:hypothetical protein